MSVLVGLVIIGGIKNILGCINNCSLYVWCLSNCMFIHSRTHFSQIPSAFSLIFQQAFSPDAAFGGFLGVLIIGIKRAVFSNEA